MSSYAKKRRFLREHRVQMRIMEDMIDEAGLYSELRDEMLLAMGKVPFWFVVGGELGGVGEAADTEDPEAVLRQQVDDLRREASGQQAFLVAAHDLAAHRSLRVDLERARTQLEGSR